MGRFAVRVAAFALLLAVVVGLGFLAKLGLESLALTRFAKTEVLILGDSHARAGLDPVVWRSAINVAQDAEPYVATYYKLDHLLHAWRRVRLVILSYSPHNLSATEDRKFTSDDYARVMFDRYGLLLAPESLAGLDVDWTQFGKSLLFRTLLLRPADIVAFYRSGGLPYLGRFRPKGSSTLGLRRLDATLGRQFGGDEGVLEASLNAERHLWRIVELCGRRGVRLFLVATPLHPEYRARVPPEIRRRYQKAAEVLARSSHVRFVDLSDLRLAAHRYYDHDHVNRKGVNRVSALLAPLVEEALLR